MSTCKPMPQQQSKKKKGVKSYNSIWLKIYLHEGKASASIPVSGQKTDNWGLTNLTSWRVIGNPQIKLNLDFDA